MTSLNPSELALFDKVVGEVLKMMPALREPSLSLSATVVARACNLVRADALERHLQGVGLPPFRLLRDWLLVVRLVDAHERGISIARSALQKGGYPDGYYRRVRATTGLGASEVTQKGSNWCRHAAVSAWRPYLRDFEL